MIIKQKTGKSVSDIIAEMVIMDAKSQLKSTDLTIQEIAYSLNFSNVSFFGKYFKRYVGMSPQNYRNSWSEAQMPIFFGKNGAPLQRMRG